MPKNFRIAVLAGDGIGPEVMEQSLRIVCALEKKFSFTLEKKAVLVGGAAIDKTGSALPKETLEACEQSNAILFGSVGGPQWDSLPPEARPERASLLPLRKRFELFANLRPAVIFESLKDASPLKPSIIPQRLDMLIVRELTGDVYFGEPKLREEKRALDTMAYHEHEIARIAHAAFAAAQGRKKNVVSIDKANVLTSMVFWREIVERVAKEYQDVTLSHMYVDNAAMQLVANPGQFDVLLCPNMFGDILSDEAAIITGSLGMLPSASLGEAREDGLRFGLYEPAGGSAPDIAGKGIANPCAQILSAALMLKYSFMMEAAHDAVFAAVDRVLREGYRTRDIMPSGISDGAASGCTQVSTEEMGARIEAAL